MKEIRDGSEIIFPVISVVFDLVKPNLVQNGCWLGELESIRAQKGVFFGFQCSPLAGARIVDCLLGEEVTAH